LSRGVQALLSQMLRGEVSGAGDLRLTESTLTSSRPPRWTRSGGRRTGGGGRPGRATARTAGRRRGPDGAIATRRTARTSRSVARRRRTSDRRRRGTPLPGVTAAAVRRRVRPSVAAARQVGGETASGAGLKIVAN